MSNFLRITIPTCVAIFATYLMFTLIVESLLSAGLPVHHDIPFRAWVLWLFVSFIFCYTLLALPFVWVILKKGKAIRKGNEWKLILSLETFGLLIAYIATPPDMISKMIVFGAWQAVILPNALVLYLISKQ